MDGFDFPVEAPTDAFGAGIEPGGLAGVTAPIDFNQVAQSLTAGRTALDAAGRDWGLPAGGTARPGAPSPSWLSDLGSFAKGVLPFAQLGLAGAGVATGIQGAQAARQQAQIQERAQKSQEQATTPLRQFGQTELARAEAGQIDPAMEAQIEQWARGAKQQLSDFYARAGLGDSSMLAQELAWIDQQATAMKASILQQMEQLGVTSLTGAAGASGQGAAIAGQQQTQLDVLIANANRAMSSLAASGT